MRQFITLVEAGLRRLLEATGAPVEGFPANPMFHGTPSASAAQSIIRNGLQPGGKSRFSGGLKPMKGRVYMTGWLFTALWDYAFHESKTAYIFVFDRDAIAQPEPDEDAVAVFFSNHCDRSLGPDDRVVLTPRDQTDPAVRATWESLRRLITDDELLAWFYGTASQRRMTPSKTAKRIMKLLSAEDRQTILHFDRTRWHDRIAIEGGITPVSGWMITREQAKNLKKDGRTIDLHSFAEHATRIL